MHTADGADAAAFFKSLPTLAQHLAESSNLRPRAVSAAPSLADTWRSIRFYRWLERFLDKEWDSMPYEVREAGRTSVDATRDAIARLGSWKFRELAAMTIMYGWRFVNLIITMRSLARVFKNVERKLAAQDKRAMDAWDRVVGHRPSFADAVKIGQEGYRREQTVEVDWATIRPHGS